MVTVSPRARGREVHPGDVVRLPRRIIDAVLRWGSDDRVVVREVYARQIYVQSIENPWAAWYVRRRMIATVWALQHAIQTNPGGVADPIQIAVLEKVTPAPAQKDTSQWRARELSADECGEHKQNIEAAEKHLSTFARVQAGTAPTTPTSPIPEPPNPAVS